MSDPEGAQSAPDVGQYIQQVVLPWLAERQDDGDKATFIGHELDKWERIERRLEEWAHVNARRDDEGLDALPNPYSPPLDAFLIAHVINRLNAELAALRDKIKTRIADAESAIKG